MATFTESPDNSWQGVLKWDVLVRRSEAGYEQRRKKMSTADRTWTLEFRNRTKAEFTTVETFVNAREGSTEAFTWTNPDDLVAYNVRLAINGFTFTRKMFDLYNYRLVFVVVK